MSKSRTTCRNGLSQIFGRKNRLKHFFQFLNRFQGKENEEFSLSELNINGVKRRIYDVINVFEGLGLITKMEPRKKNSYIWNGMPALKLNIANIKRKATLVNQNPGIVFLKTFV